MYIQSFYKLLSVASSLKGEHTMAVVRADDEDVLDAVVDAIADEMQGRLKVCKCNVEEAQDLALRFSVMSIPTLILFKGGQQVETMVGASPKASIIAKLEPHLA